MADTEKMLRDEVRGVVDILEGTTMHEDTGDPYDPTEFLDECLAIESICKGTDGSWRGASISWTIGGPNIYIDTHWNQVEGHWGGDSVTMSYRDEIGLDDYLEEIYGGNK